MNDILDLTAVVLTYLRQLMQLLACVMKVS